MDPLMWAVVVVVAVLAAALVAWAATRRRRSTALRERFGAEYDRTLRSSDDRRAAEVELEDRARRHSALEIRALPEPARLRYAQTWREIQERFVDQPAESVSSAEALLSRVMQERGYPVSDFEEQADLVSVDHPDVVQDYRAAHTIHGRMATGRVDTEDMREALVRYRSLFDGLLMPEPATTRAGAHTPTPKEST
jgi:hypothetical protein